MAHIMETERDAGVRYTVRWRDGGRFKQRTFTVKREAERFRDKVENDLAEGTSTAPLSARSKTFRETAEAMLAAQTRLKQKTLDSYDVAFRVHIYPVLGARRMTTITTADLEAFLRDLRAKPKTNGQPRSETSVLGVWKAITRTFRWAHARRMIVHDPCAAVERPRADTEEARFLSVEEVDAVAARLSEQPPYDLLVRFLAFVGLRAGECAALRIRDIDLLHAEVRVRLSKTATSKGWVTDAPKSARSVRDVPILDDGLLADLRAHIEAHPRGDDPDAGLWPGKVPGHSIVSYDHPFDPKGFYRYTFTPAARAAGFPALKLHELRHTFATLALESGALDMHELSRAMGHASYAVTDRVYAHLRRKDYSAQRARFSAHVARAVEPTQPVRLRAVEG